MKASYDNFIGVYHDVYPHDYCGHLIDEFERLTNSGAGYTRQGNEGVSRHIKYDLQLDLNINAHALTPFKDQSATDVFFAGLQSCFDDYIDNYSVLKDDKLRATHMKMQRTSPGGGYHLWHGEQGSGDHKGRGLVYMLYLNSLGSEDGGETEFLYQRKRFKPEKNVMIIWPAAFTHAHRGNTVLGNQSKYIVTGWFYYE